MTKLAFCLLALVACGNSKPDEKKEAPSTKGIDETKPMPGGGAVITPEKPPAIDATPLPTECTDYKAMVDKMNACEKFGSTKTQLADNFAKSWDAWSRLDAAGKTALAGECKQLADSIRSVGAAACGW